MKKILSIVLALTAFQSTFAAAPVALTAGSGTRVFLNFQQLVTRANPRASSRLVAVLCGTNLNDGYGGFFVSTNTVASTNTTTRLADGMYPGEYSWDKIDFDLLATGVTAGTVGNTVYIPQITYGADGRITAVSSNLVASIASDVAYDSTSWNGDTNAPSKNTVRDQVETMLTSIAAKQTGDTDLTSIAGGITGIVKGAGNGGGFSAATSGTDYAPATSGSAILKGNGSGGFSSAAAGTDYANTGQNLGYFAATTSAQRYVNISDETGSGSGALAVFSKSPTIETPLINSARATAIALGSGTSFTIDPAYSVYTATASGNVTLSLATNSVTAGVALKSPIALYLYDGTGSRTITLSSSGTGGTSFTGGEKSFGFGTNSATAGTNLVLLDWDGAIWHFDQTTAQQSAATIGAGAVSDAEFGYLDGVTSSIQSQINATQTGTHASPTTTNPLSPTWTGPLHTVWYGATGTINLPAAASYTGKAILVYNTGSFTVTIDPNSSEVVVRDGTVQTGGVNFTLSSGAGNYVALFCDGVRWITLGFKGTLSVGS